MKKNKPNNRSKKDEARPWRCAFAWQHFMLTGVAVALIVIGCVLMLPECDVRNTPGGRYAAAPGPGAFDAVRIKTAPIPLFIAYVMMIPVIMYVPRQRRKHSTDVP
ncbi:MAG: DUF3098 domain-containing protein [Bacteroidales bacterium]|nr:DUF3098 domain-containing protein [Bacteroidales bacterium]